MANSMNWCTIESDPGVFTELLARIGVRGVQMEEIYSLDADMMRELQPVFGLCFLFKWRHEKDDRPVVKEPREGLFFANQIINNACATQALLSIVMNCQEIELGSELNEFRNFTKEFDPEMKGLAISNSETIRTVHNSFARPEPFVIEEDKKATKDDDVYHFISYVPVNGVLYELDGLKPGPIDLGPCTKDDWLQKVAPVIQARIERYASSEIRFNLLALVRNRKDAAQQELKRVLTLRAAAARRLMALGLPVDPAACVEPEGGPDTSGEVHAQVTEIERIGGDEVQSQMLQLEDRAGQLLATVQAEDEKYKAWKIENMRRRHNYIPFVCEFLKILAEKKQLLPLLEKAKKSHAESAARKKGAVSS
eukprot:tig00001085_g6956.t1